MKKVINMSEIHDGKNESNLFEYNINPVFTEDIIRHATICMNSDIEEKCIYVPVQFKNNLLILKQRIYLDTRTNIIYDHFEELNSQFSYYINMKHYQEVNDDLIRHFEEFKPLNDEKFYHYDDHLELYKKLINE